jgi:hypothetical protein
MKPIRWVIALVMLLVPLAARTLWFYQGNLSTHSAGRHPGLPVLHITPGTDFNSHASACASSCSRPKTGGAL